MTHFVPSHRSIRRTQALAQAIEALESRAYLNGVVFGTPINTTAASKGIAPVYTDLVDLNGDSKADLVTSNNSQSVSILLGNGDGTFGTATTLSVDFSPLTIVDGQLGSNGKTDIVVGSSSNDKVGVILQSTGGTFSETDLTATGLTNTQSVTIGNFGNGFQDIAVASDQSATSSNVAIFLNNGTGVFTLSQVLSVPHANLASITSFTTSTGFADLAVADSANNAVTVLLNNGSGSFSVGPDYTVGASPVTIKSGQFDLNNNTNQDLVTANSQGGSVSVLLGNGDGTFNNTAVTTTVPGAPTGGGLLKVRVANLNNDNLPDLLGLYSNGSTEDGAVLLGNGDGTFHLGSMITGTQGPYTSIAAGDLNGDALTDLVLANSSNVTSLLNTTTSDTSAPTVAIAATQPGQSLGAATIEFSITYTDSQQIDVTTINSNNVVVTDPSGTTRPVTLVSSGLANGQSVTATYSVPATGGSLASTDNGNFTVTTGSTLVANANGVLIPSGTIGTFAVAVTSNGPNLVAGAVKANLKAAYVSGTKYTGGESITIVNSGNQAAKGKITIDLYASPSETIGTDATLLLQNIQKSVNLKAGGRTTLTLPAFTWPVGLTGQEFLVANINSTRTISETNYNDNLGISASSATIDLPFVDLQNLWTGKLPAIKVGKKANIAVQLKNNGNVAAKSSAVSVTVEAIPVGGGTAVTVGTPTLKVNVAANGKQTVSVPLTIAAGTLPSGSYNLMITVNYPGDTNPANNAVTSGGTFTV